MDEPTMEEPQADSSDSFQFLQRALESRIPYVDLLPQYADHFGLPAGHRTVALLNTDLERFAWSIGLGDQYYDREPPLAWNGWVGWDAAEEQELRESPATSATTPTRKT